MSENKTFTLYTIAKNKLKELGFFSNKKYMKRLQAEIFEIDIQDKQDYFLNNYKKGTRWAKNDRNLLVPYLLGLCDDFDINRDYAFKIGEFPDIDMDFLDSVKCYLRTEWAPTVFGEHNVSSIGTYQTYVLKQSLIDMARVFGLPREEIMAITKKFATKDDEGDSLTFEKAQELYPAFKNWCEKYPEAADAAKNLQGRIRNMSQHAGGFIVSNKPLLEFAPLVKNKKDDSLMTAWPEGQTSQDLTEVGLIKIDTLSSEMQQQIVDCVGLVMKRHNLKSFCDSGEGFTWSDHSYLNDPESLAMANKGDLRFIFQFDSDGMRNLVKAGGVDRFEDLEAYTSLYRPGPLNLKMHEVYCKRKRGKESYEIHPILEPYLSSTYGVMIYQEQIMQILHAVGKIPLRDAYTVVKAISKKKIEKFHKYKSIFINNAQITLKVSEKEAIDLWNNVEQFASYGFNKCLSEDTLIRGKYGLKKIKEYKPGDIVYSLNVDGKLVESKVVALHDNGIQDAYEVFFEDESSVVCTLSHKFLTCNGQVPLQEILEKKLSVLSFWQDFVKVNKIKHIGDVAMYDLEVSCETHNFILPSGIVTSNSHASAYTHQSSRQLYLKCHYPLEFFCSMLNHIRGGDEKLRDCKKDAESHGIKVNPIDINKSCGRFCIYSDNGEPSDKDEIYYGLADVKYIGEEPANRIISLREERPFLGFKDFLDRFGTDAKVVQALVSLRAFKEAEPLVLWKYYKHYQQLVKKINDKKKRLELALVKHQLQFNDIVGASVKISEVAIDEFFELLTNKDDVKNLKKLKVSYLKTINSINNIQNELDQIIDIEDFDSTVEIDIKKDIYQTLIDKNQAEMQFYGFLWENPLSICQDIQGFTLDAISKSKETGSDVGLECIIQESSERLTKKGKPFRVLNITDANWASAFVYVWEEENERFKHLLQKGNIVRLRVVPPNERFSHFTLLSFPPYKFKKPPDIKSDHRVILLKSKDAPEMPNEIIIEKNESDVTLNMLKQVQAEEFFNE